MSDRLSSAVWKRFAIDPNNDLLAICNLCNDSVSRGTTKSITTTNTREHIDTKQSLFTTQLKIQIICKHFSVDAMGIHLYL